MRFINQILSEQSPNHWERVWIQEPIEKGNTAIQSENDRRIILVAVFGGLWAALELPRSGSRILLLDRNNYRTHHPLLYQSAVD